MDWLNPYGLLFMTVIMIPNVLFALRCRDGFADRWKNKYAEGLEQIGRFGCFATMVVNIPGTCLGWPSYGAFELYLAVDTAIVALYCALWAVLFRKPGMFRSLALSILPSILFLFSGFSSRSALLVLFALLFAPSHILISCKNAK